MSILRFDEINKLVTTKRAIPYAQYFGEMQISREQKEKRIRFADLFEEMFLYPWIYMLTARNYGTKETWEKAEEKFKVAYIEVAIQSGYKPTEKMIKYLEEHKIDNTNRAEPNSNPEHKTTIKYRVSDNPDTYIEPYIDKWSDEIVETTKKHTDDPYYFSDDRLKVISENESNSFCNAEENDKAKKSGYAYKQWIAIEDMATRETHLNVSTRIIPIDDFFAVGNALMRYPKDLEYAFDNPEETVNCRCSIKYLRTITK